MGSSDHQFNLTEILSQNHSLREECAGFSLCTNRSEEHLDKDFISQSSDMPLDELIALYSYKASDPISEQESEGGNVSLHLLDMTLNKEQIAKDLLSGEDESQSLTDNLTPLVTSHEASDLFPPQSGPWLLAGEKDTVSSASSDTEDALPANKCKKEIMVGPQFQADLSSLRLSRRNEKLYENEDQLLWDPNVLPEQEVEEFLYRAVKWRWHEMGGDQLPKSKVVKDSEQVGCQGSHGAGVPRVSGHHSVGLACAGPGGLVGKVKHVLTQALYELVKCNFNTEEALRRLRFNVKVIQDGLCAWSEEERRNFEHGFRVHGKNFHLIQANKLRTRSVGECVEYYYLWKKSARYDYFAQQTRLGRRKFISSGTMDADQDLDGLDSVSPAWLRPEQESLAVVPAEPLNEAGALSQPGVGSDGLLSLEPEPSPFQQLDEPPPVPLPQRPLVEFSPVEFSAAAALEPGASPRLAVDFALPEELPLMPSHVDLSGEPTEMPAQMALSVTEFGLIGIGDVTPFLAGHPVCPTSTLHSEPLSQCNVLTC